MLASRPGLDTPRQKSHRGLRKFDHDAARRRYAAGESVALLALRYGVTSQAVSRIVVPGRYVAMAERCVSYQQSGSCPDCGTPTTRLGKDKSSLCQKCMGLRRRTSVREDTLRCSKCGLWKPDDEFPSARNKSHAGRRYHHRVCTPCQTKMRGDYRNRQKIPCDRCGAPRLPASEKGRRFTDSGLCAACWREIARVSSPVTA